MKPIIFLGLVIFAITAFAPAAFADECKTGQTRFNWKKMQEEYPQMKLNNIICEKAGQKAKETGRVLKLADGQGLYLLVKPSGTRCWRLKYFPTQGWP